MRLECALYRRIRPRRGRRHHFSSVRRWQMIGVGNGRRDDCSRHALRWPSDNNNTPAHPCNSGVRAHKVIISSSFSAQMCLTPAKRSQSLPPPLVRLHYTIPFFIWRSHWRGIDFSSDAIFSPFLSSDAIFSPFLCSDAIFSPFLSSDAIFSPFLLPTRSSVLSFVPTQSSVLSFFRRDLQSFPFFRRDLQSFPFFRRDLQSFPFFRRVGISFEYFFPFWFVPEVLRCARPSRQKSPGLQLLHPSHAHNRSNFSVLKVFSKVFFFPVDPRRSVATAPWPRRHPRIAARPPRRGRTPTRSRSRKSGSLTCGRPWPYGIEWISGIFAT